MKYLVQAFSVFVAFATFPAFALDHFSFCTAQTTKGEWYVSGIMKKVSYPEITDQFVKDNEPKYGVKFMQPLSCQAYETYHDAEESRKAALHQKDYIETDWVMPGRAVDDASKKLARKTKPKLSWGYCRVTTSKGDYFTAVHQYDSHRTDVVSYYFALHIEETYHDDTRSAFPRCRTQEEREEAQKNFDDDLKYSTKTVKTDWKFEPKGD